VNKHSLNWDSSTWCGRESFLYRNNWWSQILSEHFLIVVKSRTTENMYITCTLWSLVMKINQLFVFVSIKSNTDKWSNYMCKLHLHIYQRYNSNDTCWSSNSHYSLSTRTLLNSWRRNCNQQFACDNFRGAIITKLKVINIIGHIVFYNSTLPSLLCPLTVKHILVDCFNFNDTRDKHFVASSMEELFRTTDVHNILDVTKETNFYSKLWCLQTFLY